MNIGASANDIGLMILLLLPLTLLPIALLAIGGMIGRLLRLSGGFTLLFAIGSVAALFIGSSLWLDQAGHVVQGVTIAKTESVSIRREGDWRQQLQAGLIYHQDGSAITARTFTMSNGETGYLPTAADSSVSMRLPPAQYDALHKGVPVALRVLPLWRSLALVRLDATRTRDWVRWDWIAIGLSIFALGWLAFRIGRSTVGCLLVLALVAVGTIGGTGTVVYRQWQAMEDLNAKPLRAAATVEDVRRVTRIDPLPCESDCSDTWDTEFDVPQQYDIVQMRFVPQGADEPVLAVDAVDVGGAPVAAGSMVQLGYAAADPRAAQIIGGTHSHHWKNMIGFVLFSLASLLVLGLLALAWDWLMARFGRLLAVRRPPAP